MRRNVTATFKLILLFMITALVTAFLFKTFESILNMDNDFVRQTRIRSAKLLQHPKEWNNILFNDDNSNLIPEKIDWHDYKFIAYEKNRTGLGEQGEPGHLPKSDEEKAEKIFRQNGYDGLLSDRISLNRSIPDIRHKDCSKQLYLSKLPSVSVVVPFYNEHLSALLRTCYSILSRSPEELIVEIILVDDYSTKDLLKTDLDRYVAKHLPKVKVIRLKERSGLILARMQGAKIAKGEVLIFLDAHTEANVNWLPPLLDPIAENYKVCVCPFIDVISYDTFEYRSQDEGARGAFDWSFDYKRLPLLPEDLKHPVRPFKSPVMAGGLFAISAKFFWELGGYDEGLDIWGGEQYELSFKIWQCGGEMYDAPCSRVGHIYRGKASFVPPRETDYVRTNFKRVAEVWMDEYKDYLYAREPTRYKDIDPGDLSKQKAIREKLQCKPFKWFMENVAFDLVERYPPTEPPNYAWGAIKSLANPSLCVDTLGHGTNNHVGLYPCAKNLKEPQKNQNYALNLQNEIILRFTDICLDVPSQSPDVKVILYSCHGQKGPQYWKYDLDNKWIFQKDNRCLDANVNKRLVVLNKCDANNVNMKWEFGFMNYTLLKTSKDNKI